MHKPHALQKLTKSAGFSRGGLFLLTFLALALLVPLLWLDTDHPLSKQAQVDLCAFVRPAAAGHYPGEALRFDTQILGFRASPMNCAVYRTDGAPSLWASLMTRKSLFGEAMWHADTRRFLDASIDELQADGKSVEAADGAWSRAVLIHDPRHPSRVEFLAEDYGVILRLGSDEDGAEAVTDFARRLAEELRRKRAE